MFNCIKDIFLQSNLPLEKLQGYCFDGPSNMSGCCSGVQVQLEDWGWLYRATLSDCTVSKAQKLVPVFFLVMKMLCVVFLGCVQQGVVEDKSNIKNMSCLWPTFGDTTYTPMGCRCLWWDTGKSSRASQACYEGENCLWAAVLWGSLWVLQGRGKKSAWVHTQAFLVRSSAYVSSKNAYVH